MIRPIDLPYRPDALEPVISEQSMLLHFALYERYIQRVNTAAPGLHSAQEAVVAAKDAHDLAMLHNAQQILNHEFAFLSMKPAFSNAPPSGSVGSLIAEQWGDPAEFWSDWLRASTGMFGSGYVWLVMYLDEIPFGQLRIVALPNSDGPTGGVLPLMAMDVWEHAWYIDHPLMRDRYAAGWLDMLADWERVNARLHAGVS